uniref:Uncharacterized protein n=1 Tax=Arundo donax TaxID=35708 RepID=A0A0A9DBE3_ARUDO
MTGRRPADLACSSRVEKIGSADEDSLTSLLNQTKDHQLAAESEGNEDDRVGGRVQGGGGHGAALLRPGPRLRLGAVVEALHAGPVRRHQPPRHLLRVPLLRLRPHRPRRHVRHQLPRPGRRRRRQGRRRAGPRQLRGRVPLVRGQRKRRRRAGNDDDDDGAGAGCGGCSYSWCITGFLLAALNNALPMGIPLLNAMYGEWAHDVAVQMSMMQIVVWFPLMLVVFEARQAWLEMPLSGRGAGRRRRARGGRPRGLRGTGGRRRRRVGRGSEDDDGVAVLGAAAEECWAQARLQPQRLREPSWGGMVFHCTQVALGASGHRRWLSDDHVKDRDWTGDV